MLCSSYATRFLTKVVCASCIVPGCFRASCSLHAAARKCSVQVALSKCSEQVALRTCSAPVAPCERFAHVLCASWSVQVALRKCFVQVLCAIRRAQVALRQSLCASCSAQVLPELWECASRVLFLYLKVATFQPELRECAPRTTLYLKVAIFQPELREHAPHTTSVLKSCDFPAGAAGARSAYYVCTYKLRFSSRSCRGPGGNRTRDRGIAKAGARAARQLPKAISRATNLHGATARALQHARSPPRAACRNRKKSSAFEPRPRESPQRVACAPQKS